MIYILIYLFIVAILFIVKAYILAWGAVIFGAISIIFLLISNEKIKNERAEKKEAAEKERAEAEDAYNKKRAELTSKHGTIINEILIGKKSADNAIWVFGETGRIYILGKDLPMSSIISCNISDSQTIKRGESKIQTKTNTGDVAKRAIVGGVLLGGAGAIAGGVTAQKDSTIEHGDDTIIHNYTITINVNDLSSPVISIKCGHDTDKANEIMGLFNVILKENLSI